MRIPLSDKFLWDLYNVIEAVGDILEPPEVFRLKTFSELCDCGKFKYWKEYHKKKDRKQFAQFIYYLKRKGYIKIKSLKEGKGILLTSIGEQKALTASYKLDTPKLKKRKDKKWIMVIFDIPEKKRKYRDDFRGFLCSLGFKKLQQSVWVSPYDVYKDLERIIRTYFLDEFVRIFIIKEIQI